MDVIEEPTATNRRRVAVTGLGVVSPAGCDIETLRTTMLAGTSVVDHDPELGNAGAPITMSARVQEFDSSRHLSRKETRRLDRSTQFGLCAALDSLGDAGNIDADPARCAVVTGTGIGNVSTAEQEMANFLASGPRAISPLTVPATMANATAALVSMRLGWTGPSTCTVTACAAGAQAIGEGAELVRHGRADLVLAGGFEAAVTAWNISAFWRVAALSSRRDSPQHASRPFDASRDGFVMGEGAAFLVLEEWERAQRRSARIHAELAGFGWNNDAFHLTAPSPDGAGAATCIGEALDDANLAPDDIVHVNAHGTSTRANDALESEAVVQVFGTSTPVTAPKGIFGHLIGAAGAVESVASIAAMTDGQVPPVANLEEVDGEVKANLVQEKPLAVPSGAVASNSFGFGGHNVTLIFVPPTHP